MKNIQSQDDLAKIYHQEGHLAEILEQWLSEEKEELLSCEERSLFMHLKQNHERAQQALLSLLEEMKE